MGMNKTQLYQENLCKEIMMTAQEQLCTLGVYYAPYIYIPKIMKPKYQFSRAKWHTVDIGDGIWRLGREYNEIIEWCTKHFGKHPNRPDAWSRWWVGVGSIYFSEEKYFVFYQLNWS
jgi:hypothetical protein